MSKEVLKAEWVNVAATVACFVASLSVTITVLVTMVGAINTKIDGFQAEMRDIHGRVSKLEVEKK